MAGSILLTNSPTSTKMDAVDVNEEETVTYQSLGVLPSYRP